MTREVIGSSREATATAALNGVATEMLPRVCVYNGIIMAIFITAVCVFGCFPVFHAFPRLCFFVWKEYPGDLPMLRGLRGSVLGWSWRAVRSLYHSLQGPRAPAERKGGKNTGVGGQRVGALCRTILGAKLPPSSGLLDLLKTIILAGLVDCRYSFMEGACLVDQGSSPEHPAIPPNQILSRLQVASGKY